jgi:hypothetical protein
MALLQSSADFAAAPRLLLVLLAVLGSTCVSHRLGQCWPKEV